MGTCSAQEEMLVISDWMCERTSSLFPAIVVVSLDHHCVAAADAAPLAAAGVIAAAERPTVGARVGEGALRELLAQKVCLGRELGKERE